MTFENTTDEELTQLWHKQARCHSKAVRAFKSKETKMKPITILNIVEYFTLQEATEEMYEYLRDSVKLCGFDFNVPISIQGCVNCYLFCEPGEQAALWFHEVCKRIGHER